MGRFASTAAVYAKARPPYGEAFFAGVAERLTLSGTERLLDLGSGPGVLALGFAPFVGEVVAVDPEPAMVAAARAAATGAAVPIRMIEGHAESLPAGLGPFDVVTIGRALHWMEPTGLGATLERIVGVAGAVVVCGADANRDANGWLAAYEDVRRRWSGGAERIRADDETIFAGTRFRRGERLVVRFSHEVTPDLLADRVLSMSSSSPERLGDRATAMRAEIASALAPFTTGGTIREEIEARAEILRAA